MKVSQETIKKINLVAQENFDRARGMLTMLNELAGTEFGWLNKRVVWFEEPEKKYHSPCHDLWATMEGVNAVEIVIG